LKSLVKFFNPKSVAIVGVSAEKRKVGTSILLNLISSNFKGKIFPINPKYSFKYGFKFYKSIGSINEKIDLACIAIPKEFVLKVIEECIEKKIKNIVIVTAGFKEKNKEGKDLEGKIFALAKENNLNILGPNSLGFISKNLNLSFSRNTPLLGDIGLISQSGAFCTSLIDFTLERKIGFSKIISIGNKTILNENDFLKYLIQDYKTKIIGLYLENFSDAKEFFEIAKSSSKPIVMIKTGKSETGSKAISTHTGSIVSDHIFYEASAKKQNIITVESINEFIDVISILNYKKPILGRNVGVITNAGGHGIIFSDLADKYQINLKSLSSITIDKIKKNFENLITPNNPLDIIGDAKADRFLSAVNILNSEKNFDLISIIISPQAATEIELTILEIARLNKNFEKPVYFILMGDWSFKNSLKTLYSNSIPFFYSIESFLSSINKVSSYYLKTKKRNRIINKISSYLEKIKYKGKIRTKIFFSKKILDSDLFEICKEVNINLPKQIIVESKDDLNKINFYPVVLKILSQNAIHKTESGGVIVDIKSFDELVNHYINFEKNYKQGKYLVQEQLKGFEIFLGIKKENEDTSSRFLITIGQGGIYSEILNDFGFLVTPFSENEILEALNETKLIKIISGARKKQKANLKALVDSVMALQKICYLYPEISSLDINPLFLNNKTAVVADIKALLSP